MRDWLYCNILMQSMINRVYIMFWFGRLNCIVNYFSTPLVILCLHSLPYLTYYSLL